MTSRRVRVPLLLFGTLLLHVTVLSRLGVAGVRPDVLLLLAVAAGLTGGAERGAAVGFAAGLFGDLFVGTPLGLSSLTFSLVGFVVGVLQSSILRATWWIGPATAFVASASSVIVYALLGAVVGWDIFVRPELAVIVVVVATVNAALALPALRATTWAFAEGRPERSYV